MVQQLARLGNSAKPAATRSCVVGQHGRLAGEHDVMPVSASGRRGDGSCLGCLKRLMAGPDITRPTAGNATTAM